MSTFWIRSKFCKRNLPQEKYLNHNQFNIWPVPPSTDQYHPLMTQFHQVLTMKLLDIKAVVGSYQGCCNITTWGPKARRPSLVDTKAAVISRPERRRRKGRRFGGTKGRRTTIPISLMFKSMWVSLIIEKTFYIFIRAENWENLLWMRCYLHLWWYFL